MKDLISFQNPSNAKENKDVSVTVQEILETVREKGDSALREYTERFDNVTPESWLVPKPLLTEALENLDHELFHILEEAADNIMFFHERQKKEANWISVQTVLFWVGKSHQWIVSEFISPEVVQFILRLCL